MHRDLQPHLEVEYSMDVELLEQSHQISGHSLVRVTNTTGKSLPELYFHLYPNAFKKDRSSSYVQELKAFENPDMRFIKNEESWMQISSVQQASAAVRFSIKKELMTVVLSQPLVPGQSTVIKIDFVTQLGAISERSGYWDGNYSVSLWYPQLMGYDRRGWPLEHNSDYHYLGEFLGNYGSYDVRITVPQEMKIGATGSLLSSESVQDGKMRYAYRAMNVHDFAWVADRRYELTDVKVGGTTIHVLTRFAQDKVNAEYAKKAFEYFTKRIGPYPYSDFTVASTFYNGSMEFPQIVFMRTWPTALTRTLERDAFRLQENLIAHETAHQWFYGVVGNNGNVDAWLDEGFATYYEQAYFRDLYGSEDNLVKFTSILQITDRQLGELLWRIYSPNNRQPIQTPAYQFRGPMYYYMSTYYKTAHFLRHFEALLGRQRFDKLLQMYYEKNKFRNVDPDDWYALVREQIGSQAEGWWRKWVTQNLRSDYSISDVSTKKLEQQQGAPVYVTSYKVEQEGEFFVPVEVEITDRKGAKTRVMAPIDEKQHAVHLEIRTTEPVDRIEVDPDHVAPDLERFNNRPGFFSDFKIWPFTTKTFSSDAMTLVPLPYVIKTPGLGLETGAILGVAHYVDWFGYLQVGHLWRHNKPTVGLSLSTLQPEHEANWGWDIDYQQDVIFNRAHIYAKKPLGPLIDYDPSQTLLFGVERYGQVGDEASVAMGLGADYLFSNYYTGRALRYSLKLHHSVLQSVQIDNIVNRGYAEVRVNVPLFYKAQLDVRGFIGSSTGKVGSSSLYNYLAYEDGRMRFDTEFVESYKSQTIKTLNVELRLPVPYTGWSDALAFINGMNWQWHLFADLSNTPNQSRLLMDAGIGTRFDFATGSYGQFGLSMELVPYQTGLETNGWVTPAFLLNISDRWF